MLETDDKPFYHYFKNLRLATLENIQEKIMSHIDEDIIAVICFGSQWCHVCPDLYASIDRKLAETYKKYIVFYYVELEDRPPFFAPSCIPSMLVYIRGNKYHEGWGTPNFEEQLKYYFYDIIMYGLPIEVSENDEELKKIGQEIANGSVQQRINGNL